MANIRSSRKIGFNNGTDTWSAADESSNGQMSLDQGSSVYENFIEAKEEAAPSAPDDEVHEELEAYNESRHSLRLAEKAFNQEYGKDDTNKIRFRRQQAKRAVDKAAHSAAVREAFKTLTDDDDERLDDYVVKDTMIYDDGITPDEFDELWLHYTASGDYM